jgi:hypothetical protein
MKRVVIPPKERKEKKVEIKKKRKTEIISPQRPALSLVEVRRERREKKGNRKKRG